ncbi:disintegrin and metalloproteinase domain-containing protein 33-like [Anopheles aquasalis]|uniref:disintegrin and metalloproteinase domain-containing protein 33-like n=1 Tax=Anopheles aquasalis TaxID=42839 RepID=UPI00215A99E5|nr:disintegrin and metalloproteinase domain-containing protein 33-like [Anopheles aquasalis]
MSTVIVSLDRGWCGGFMEGTRAPHRAPSWAVLVHRLSVAVLLLLVIALLSLFVAPSNGLATTDAPLQPPEWPSPDRLAAPEPPDDGSRLSPNTFATDRRTTSGAGQDFYGRNPIYPLLIPSNEPATATLTYNLNDKVTVLHLIRTAVDGGCQHYRHASRNLPHEATSQLVSCDDRINGTIHHDDASYRIEYDASAGLHFIERLQETRHDGVDTVRHRAKRNHGGSIIRGPYQANRHSRFVEMVLVVDRAFYQRFDKDEWKVYDYCTSIVNHINMMYNPLNIFIALTNVIVWKDRDLIEISNSSEVTLNRFLKYREQKLLPEYRHDHAQLLTAIQFDGNVIGKAKVSGMCSDQSSGAIVFVHTDSVEMLASTVAHEMGHSFAMEHDDYAKCHCPDAKCIMSSSVSAPLKHWSNCSVLQLATAFERGLQACLTNRPTYLAIPSCGNGFVEPGEECDCGLEEACENHCCNATTCTLRPGAQCATGECCNMETCRVLEATTVCRPAEGECDLPEFCSGESEYCPRDVFKRDTEVCADGEAHCLAGRCRTRTDQCRFLWGASGRAAGEECYALNRQGAKHGNCGYEVHPEERYHKCHEGDELCGVLFCHHLRSDPELDIVLFHDARRKDVRRHNDSRRYIHCYSAHVDLMDDGHGHQPAFVPDGAPCGPERMCYQKRCVRIDELDRKSCPHDCNGRGICNSNGNCHCSPGYDPPFCEHAGVGGSIDSGPPALISPVRHYLTVTALVVLLCVVAIVLIMLWLRIPYHRPMAAGFCDAKRWMPPWAQPWRFYRVRGSSPRTVSLRPPAGVAINQHNISLPSFHSSTKDINNDRQFRPIEQLRTLPPLAPETGRKITVVRRPEGRPKGPPLTIEYPVVSSTVGTATGPTVGPVVVPGKLNHRQLPAQWGPPVRIHQPRMH